MALNDSEFSSKPKDRSIIVMFFAVLKGKSIGIFLRIYLQTLERGQKPI